MWEMSTLSQFPLESGSEDCFFLDQAVEDFVHGLDSILMDSIDTPELDAAFYSTDAFPSLIS